MGLHKGQLSLGSVNCSNKSPNIGKRLMTIYINNLVPLVLTQEHWPGRQDPISSLFLAL